MQTAKLFMNGKSQAVRLPKEFRFEGEEVVIKKVGEMVVLLPLVYRADDLAAALETLDPNFQISRDQPQQDQKRRY